MKTDTPPAKVEPKLKSAPKIRQFYWCKFPEDAQAPEFWKNRPVIVVSKNAKLHGSVTLVPCSTSEKNKDNPYAFELPVTISGERLLEGGKSWAICDHLTTLAVSRLTPDKSGKINRLSEEAFNNMLKIILDYLPKLKS